MSMNEILFEDESKPTKEAQLRLISNSKWVSPIQVVSKKSGIIVVKNEDNELVPTHLQTR